MQTVVVSELMSAAFVIISLIGQYSNKDKQKSTRSLRICSILLLFWLLTDAAAYSINGPQYSHAFLWIINLLAYTMGGLVFIAFTRYCYHYIAERAEIKQWVLLIPVIVTVINELIIIVLYVSGKIISIDNGFVVTVGALPTVLQILNIILLIYLPAVAFTKRKQIGRKAVSLLGMYGVAPIIAIAIVFRTGLDFTISFGAISVVIVATLLQNAEVEKRIRSMNAELGNKNTKLSQMAEEQEAQLEEIDLLNKQLEEKQHYTDELYHRLLKVQACGIVAYKVPQYEILVMNDMARKLYGISLTDNIDSEEVIRQIAKARYDDEELTKERLRNIKNPGDLHSFTFWLDSKEGTERHLYVTTQLIQMENGERIIVSSMLDISEITEMERIAAQANAANLAKTNFLFNMSHDIRTPMNAIIGYSELMERNLENTEKIKDYLGKIKSSSDFLLSLINNVLEMSRIESGKAELDEEILGTGIIVNEVRSVYEELMKEKNICFEENVDIATKYVFGDRVKLNEIVLNLVSNAYKYTPEGGSVTLSMKELPCDREGWTILQTTVSDTGIGMSEEYLPILFEEFTRERNATDAKVQGTGLGLPIVKKLVDMMEGTITVDSEAGKGTSFVVTTPHRIANAPEEYSVQLKEANTDALIGKRVLLAEDNDLNAEIAMEILSEAGMIVDRAEDGIICVNMILKAPANTYDIILMDIQMPNMDGYKATTKIRRLSDREKANIPIVAMTANAFETDRQNAFAAGMNGHLAKPINVSELMTTLAGILG